MSAYILNLYYPSLKTHATYVQQAKDIVEKLAGKHNYRMIRAGGNICTIAFFTDIASATFNQAFTPLQAGEQFQYLILEFSDTSAGWTDPDVYKWLQWCSAQKANK